MNVSEQSEKIVAEIKRRTLLFCTDNPQFANHMDVIEIAMLIGASVGVQIYAAGEWVADGVEEQHWRNLDERAASMPLGEG